MRNLYNENEIIVCTYIAIFGRKDFNENDVVNIKNRSLTSITLKVQNIASMLDEAGVETSDEIPKLTGLPPGQKGRKTNWDIVKQYINMPMDEHRQRCVDILSNQN